MGVSCNSRNVEQHNEEKDHRTQERCGQLRVFLDHDAQGRGDQRHANEIDQKNMRGNPGGDTVGHQPAQGEVFSREIGQWNSVKETAKRHELIEAGSLWNFTHQYYGKADGQNGCAEEVRPEDGCRDGKHY